MSPGIFVRDTGTIAGKGVYAEVSFDQGEVVEICPVILLTGELASIPESLRRLVFRWPGERYALALGYGSVYNHSDDPNLHFSRDLANLDLKFTALKRIEAGDQLTINYNQATNGQPEKKDWFKANMIEKIDMDDLGQDERPSS